MTRITAAEVYDIRFPTSQSLDGSDAMYQDPDYSAAYITLKTNHPEGLDGNSLVFTIGRGTELCVEAIRMHLPKIVDRSLDSLTSDWASFWQEVHGDSQLRWLGPEKGIIYMAAGAIINAVWDLKAKVEQKPLWRLIVDMNPEELIACIDFSYIDDVLGQEEALGLLQKMQATQQERIDFLEQNGYPAYTTSVGWMGYPDDKIRELCREAMGQGWQAFKMKVGGDEADDIRRAGFLREIIGKEGRLMMDANEIWGVQESIRRMNNLKAFDPFWIEEPTSPDDILGHAEIARNIAPIPIATGEVCHNRVMFKQFMQAKAIGFCQVDAVRMGGLNEVLAVLLMARKFDIPVCPHAGGVGLCELAQHIAMIDYVAISGTMENRMIEYVDHLHEHFIDPVIIHNGRYMPPVVPGYNISMKPESISTFRYDQ